MSLDPSTYQDDISVIEGTKNELIVFEKEADRLSFLELLKINKQSNNRSLVTLHSAVNTDKFLNRYQDFEGKIFLCLQGNKTGDAATLKIQMEFKKKNIKDIRAMYDISQGGNHDLSVYLQRKLNLQNKNITFVEPKNTEDADVTIRPKRVSNTQYLGSEFPGRNSGESLQTIQSEQIKDYAEGL